MIWDFCSVIVLHCVIGISTSKHWKNLVKHRWPCHRESVSRISIFGNECKSTDVLDARRYYFSLHIRDLFEQHDLSMIKHWIYFIEERLILSDVVLFASILAYFAHGQWGIYNPSVHFCDGMRQYRNYYRNSMCCWISPLKNCKLILHYRTWIGRNDFHDELLWKSIQGMQPQS